jgi:hypothetical protein
MSTWAWVGVGLAAFCVISTLVGLAMAAILGRIGEAVSGLLDEETWARAPVSRERVQSEDNDRLIPDREKPTTRGTTFRAARRSGEIRRRRAS